MGPSFSSIKSLTAARIKFILRPLTTGRGELDNKKQLDETIQKTTDTYIKKVDDMVKVKSADLLKV
eukprot:gene22688-29841_t